ncbi:MAG: histidinol-phosphatase [Verrucomicrobiota bacterium]
MHTPLCKHAIGHPSDYVAVGHGRGLRGIIFTCHSPMPDRWSHAVRMDPEQFDEYVRLVEEAKDRAPEGFEVRLGLESDYFPGMESWLRALHQRAEFHYILGSVHWHVPEYRESFWKGDILAFQQLYFEHLADSAETGLFDSLAHPDLVKNADPNAYDLAELKDHVASSLDRIAKTGVAMELNTSGAYKAYPEMNPGPEMLRLMAEREIPVVVGSDSHSPDRVGDRFEEALDALEEAGFTHVHFFEHRQPQKLSLTEARANLSVEEPLSV